MTRHIGAAEAADLIENTESNYRRILTQADMPHLVRKQLLDQAARAHQLAMHFHGIARRHPNAVA